MKNQKNMKNVQKVQIGLALLSLDLKKLKEIDPNDKEVLYKLPKIE